CARWSAATFDYW
nr:immunoglobulin heavy chain junction region [Macaca mulatta]MOV50040.1 immunoglobulin heavy chain junction region [Macaca mulatta]MOV50273.1 immunoglobulin heavy chain junction region [Macaca mulatta]MOV50380.1 immunoglobulin heavy chain junction region [Macaca mulatta]